MPIRGEGVSTALTAMAMVPLPGAKAQGEATAAQFQPNTLLTDQLRLAYHPLLTRRDNVVL